MFKSRQRIESAFAKGLMLGKAVATRDERDRVVKLLQAWVNDDNADFSQTIEKIKKGK